MTDHKTLVDGKPVPNPKYFVVINEFIMGHPLPSKSTVLCACYDKATAEWIKDLIMKAYPEYTYGKGTNQTEILVEDDSFYLSDDYRDVKNIREYHTRKSTGKDLSYLSTIF